MGFETDRRGSERHKMEWDRALQAVMFATNNPEQKQNIRVLLIISVNTHPSLCIQPTRHPCHRARASRPSCIDK